jgi:hypothetical protein
MVSAVLAALLAAGAAVWSSGAVAELLRTRLVSYAQARHWGQVELGGVTLSLLPPTIAVTEASWTPPGAEGPAVSLRHGRLIPYLWPAPSGAPVIAVLSLEGLKADVSALTQLTQTASSAPRPHADAATAQAWHLPVDVRDLTVHNSELTWRKGPHYVRLGGLNLEMYASARHGRVLRASVQTGTAYWPTPLIDAPVPFDAHVEAELSGSLDRPQLVHLSQTQVHAAGSRLGLSGHIELAPQHADRPRQMKLEANWVADLERLAHIWPTAPKPLSGRVQLQTLWQGALKDPSVDVEVSCEHLVVGRRPIGDVGLEAAGSRRGLTVEQLQLRLPDGGSITGSGRLGFETPYTLELAAHLQQAALPAILEAVGLPGAWIRMHLLGDVQGVGTLRPFHLSLVTDVNVRGFSVLDRSHHDPEAKAVLHIPSGSLRGTAEVGPTQTHVDAVEVASGASQLTLGGTLPYATGRDVHLKVAARGFELADLGPIAGIPFAGLGGFEATIVGPYNHLDIGCSLTAADFRVYGYALGDTQAKLRYHAPNLTIAAIEAQRPQGRVWGSGQLVFAAPHTRVQGEFETERLELGGLLADLGLSPTFARHFRAAVTGRLRLDGPLKHVAGTADLRAPHLVVDGVPLGSMHLEGSFGRPPARLWGTLTLRPDDPAAGAMVCHSELFEDGQLSLSASLQRIPLPLLTPFAGDVPITGILTAQAAFDGPPRDLHGTVLADIRQAEAWGVRLGHVHLGGQAHGSTLHVDGHLLGAQVLLGGRLQLTAPGAFTAQLRFADLQAHALHRSLPALLEARLGGEIQADGHLGRPTEIVAEARLRHVDIGLHQLRLANAAPIVLRYRKGHLTLAPATLTGPGLRVQATGTLPVGEDMDVRLAVAGDLSAVRSVRPELAAARGPWSLRMALSGPPAAPVINGEGALDNGSLRLADSEQILDRLRLRALFTGRSVALHSGYARLGGGNLRFSGEAQLGTASDPTPRLNVHMALQQVGLRPYPELDSTVSGTLDLGGKMAALSMHGALKVDQLRYTARIDIDRLLPKRNAPPLKAPLMPVDQAVRLAVKLHAPNNVIISSSMLEAELQADLTLTGTTERMGLLGNVTPLWARARYRDNVFKLTRAAIDFVDEYRVYPEFSLQAHTQACNLQADVSIQGNADSYTVTPYGQDEHGAVDPQDVLACLQFGLRLRDFAGNQKNAAGLGDALPSGLDALWAVSGMDDKVRKLLPISVDEIRLTSGWSSLSQRNTARVLVGKELGGHVALRYSRSLDEYNDQAFSVDYRLHPRLTLQGSWLTAQDVPVGDFGVDLRLHWELQ